MWISQIIMAIIGLSSGALVAGGLFGFVVSLGVISDFADRSKTADKIRLYEDAVALGAVLGNVFYLYQIAIPGFSFMTGIFGIFAGVFVGCWAMALTEVLNVFPIFTRRFKITKGIAYIILSIAIGKGVGSVIYFLLGW